MVPEEDPGGTSVLVQWLRLCTSSERVAGSIPGQECGMPNPTFGWNAKSPWRRKPDSRGHPVAAVPSAVERGLDGRRRRCWAPLPVRPQPAVEKQSQQKFGGPFLLGLQPLDTMRMF